MQEQEEQMMHEQEQRRLTLELLEVQSINRTLELQHRRCQREVSQLTQERVQREHSNAALRAELNDAKATIKRLRHEERRLSNALAKQAVVLTREMDIRRNAEETLARSQAALGELKTAARTGVWGDSSVDEISNNSDSCAGSSSEKLPADGVMDTGPFLPELEQHVRSCLAGPVSRWVQDMQAACSQVLNEAPVLPWLLQKLFFLCTELIDERRQELTTVFIGGGAESAADEDKDMGDATADFMHTHLRRHHLTLFPLSGSKLKDAVETIMMALAYRCVFSSPL